MKSPSAETPSDGSPGKSRLDREIEEILSRDDNLRHLPPPPKQGRRRSVPKTASPQAGSLLTPRVRQLLMAPVVLALGLAVIALLVSGVSPFLANILCLAAVVCIILPMIQRFRRPSAPPETRMWRGQVIDMQPSGSRSPLDSLRDWWKSRGT